MSAPIAEPGRSAGAGIIVGVALLLMLLAALTAFLIAWRGGPIDGAAQLESAFGVRTIGDEYTLESAREMPGGARLIVFVDRSAAPEAVLAVPDPKAKKKPDEEKVDWTHVTIPPATTRPRRVTFLFSAAGSSHYDMAAFFHDIERKSIEDLGPEGGKVTIETGKLAWRGFDADWVHERAFEAGGTFRDEMRVDLSLEKKPCVMTAVWSRGETGSKAELDKLLAALGTK
jgi:hypothetical protein